MIKYEVHDIRFLGYSAVPRILNKLDLEFVDVRLVNGPPRYRIGDCVLIHGSGKGGSVTRYRIVKELSFDKTTGLIKLECEFAPRSSFEA